MPDAYTQLVQDRIDKIERFKTTLEADLAEFEPLYKQAQAEFARTMLDMGPKTRANLQFALKAGRNRIEELNGLIEECNHSLIAYRKTLADRNNQ